MKYFNQIVVLVASLIAMNSACMHSNGSGARFCDDAYVHISRLIEDEQKNSYALPCCNDDYQLVKQAQACEDGDPCTSFELYLKAAMVCWARKTAFNLSLNSDKILNSASWRKMLYLLNNSNNNDFEPIICRAIASGFFCCFDLLWLYYHKRNDIHKALAAWNMSQASWLKFRLFADMHKRTNTNLASLYYLCAGYYGGDCASYLKVGHIQREKVVELWEASRAQDNTFWAQYCTDTLQEALQQEVGGYLLAAMLNPNVECQRYLCHHTLIDSAQLYDRSMELYLGLKDQGPHVVFNVLHNTMTLKNSRLEAIRSAIQAGTCCDKDVAYASYSLPFDTMYADSLVPLYFKRLKDCHFGCQGAHDILKFLAKSPWSPIICEMILRAIELNDEDVARTIISIVPHDSTTIFCNINYENEFKRLVHLAEKGSPIARHMLVNCYVHSPSLIAPCSTALLSELNEVQLQHNRNALKAKFLLLIGGSAQDRASAWDMVTSLLNKDSSYTYLLFTWSSELTHFLEECCIAGDQYAQLIYGLQCALAKTNYLSPPKNSTLYTTMVSDETVKGPWADYIYLKIMESTGKFKNLVPIILGYFNLTYCHEPFVCRQCRDRLEFYARRGTEPAGQLDEIRKRGDIPDIVSYLSVIKKYSGRVPRLREFFETYLNLFVYYMGLSAGTAWKDDERILMLYALESAYEMGLYDDEKIIVQVCREYANLCLREGKQELALRFLNQAACYADKASQNKIAAIYAYEPHYITPNMHWLKQYIDKATHGMTDSNILNFYVQLFDTIDNYEKAFEILLSLFKTDESLVRCAANRMSQAFKAKLLTAEQSNTYAMLINALFAAVLGKEHHYDHRIFDAINTKNDPWIFYIQHLLIEHNKSTGPELIEIYGKLLRSGNERWVGIARKKLKGIGASDLLLELFEKMLMDKLLKSDELAWMLDTLKERSQNDGASAYKVALMYKEGRSLPSGLSIPHDFDIAFTYATLAARNNCVEAIDLCEQIKKEQLKLLEVVPLTLCTRVRELKKQHKKSKRRKPAVVDEQKMQCTFEQNVTILHDSSSCQQQVNPALKSIIGCIDGGYDPAIRFMALYLQNDHPYRGYVKRADLQRSYELLNAYFRNHPGDTLIGTTLLLLIAKGTCIKNCIDAQEYVGFLKELVARQDFSLQDNEAELLGIMCYKEGYYAQASDMFARIKNPAPHVAWYAAASILRLDCHTCEDAASLKNYLLTALSIVNDAFLIKPEQLVDCEFVLTTLSRCACCAAQDFLVRIAALIGFDNTKLSCLNGGLDAILENFIADPCHAGLMLYMVRHGLCEVQFRQCNIHDCMMVYGQWALEKISQAVDPRYFGEIVDQLKHTVRPFFKIFDGVVIESELESMYAIARMLINSTDEKAKTVGLIFFVTAEKLLYSEHVTIPGACDKRTWQMDRTKHYSVEICESFKEQATRQQLTGWQALFALTLFATLRANDISGFKAVEPMIKLFDQIMASNFPVFLEIRCELAYIYKSIGEKFSTQWLSPQKEFIRYYKKAYELNRYDADIVVSMCTVLLEHEQTEENAQKGIVLLKEMIKKCRSGSPCCFLASYYLGFLPNPWIKQDAVAGAYYLKMAIERGSEEALQILTVLSDSGIAICCPPKNQVVKH